jgi:hypothetical protein
MYQKKLVTLPKLISFILSFTEENVNKDFLETVFPDTIKSNDEFTFKCLEYGETKNINDFPQKLKSIFDPYIRDFIRYGSRTTFDNDANLSFYYCVLSYCIDNFNKMSIKDQFNNIVRFRDKLIMHVSSEAMLAREYDKLGWTKKDLMNSLVQFKTNKLIIKLIADYLNLNIYILNVTEDKIYVVSENTFYDMFRPNIFLVCNEETFENVIYSGMNVLNYNVGVIKKLTTVDKAFLILMDTNLNDHERIGFNCKFVDLSKYSKFLKKSDELNQMTNIENENEYEEIIPNDSDVNAYVKDIESTQKSIEAQQLVFKISGKMKLEELQVVAKKLNIDLEKSGKQQKKIIKTKGDLIDEINSVLKK